MVLYFVIVFCKVVLEFFCLLSVSNEIVCLEIGLSNICVMMNDVVFMLKLIDGCFFDYCRVLFCNVDCILEVDIEVFCWVLMCVVILLNEKFCGVCLIFE